MKYRSVIVEWIDAKASIDGGVPDLPTLTACGFLIHKDKKKITVASLLDSDGDPLIAQSIPASLVRKITRLK